MPLAGQGAKLRVRQPPLGVKRTEAHQGLSPSCMCCHLIWSVSGQFSTAPWGARGESGPAQTHAGPQAHPWRQGLQGEDWQGTLEPQGLRDLLAWPRVPRRKPGPKGRQLA